MKNKLKFFLKCILPNIVLVWISKIISRRKKSFFKLKRIPTRGRQDIKYIVTLTTYGKRLCTTAPYAIASILRQNELPDSIVLWLSTGTVVPDVYKKLIKYGLQIKFCDDLKSYKKLIPALKEFPDKVLITIDDDVFYPKNWFEKMKQAHLLNPKKICAIRAHRIVVDKNNNIQKYETWEKEVVQCSDAQKLFPTGVSGILYPPGSLNSKCTDIALFNRLAPFADDIWFWAMAKLNNVSYYLVPFNEVNFNPVDSTDGGLWESHNQIGGNDIQMSAILDEFPELINKI